MATYGFRTSALRRYHLFMFYSLSHNNTDGETISILFTQDAPLCHSRSAVFWLGDDWLFSGTEQPHSGNRRNYGAHLVSQVLQWLWAPCYGLRGFNTVTVLVGYSILQHDLCFHGWVSYVINKTVFQYEDLFSKYDIPNKKTRRPWESLRSSCLYNGNSYTGKTPFFFTNDGLV